MRSSGDVVSVGSLVMVAVIKSAVVVGLYCIVLLMVVRLLSVKLDTMSYTSFALVFWGGSFH